MAAQGQRADRSERGEGAAGLEPDMGPFATSVESDLDSVLDAATSMMRAGFAAGATAIQLRVDVL